MGRKQIIAEDLGFITPPVRRLLEDTGFPGMKLLQFGFDRRDGGGRVYQPTIIRETVRLTWAPMIMTRPLAGWRTADPEDVALAREYLRLEKGKEENWGMMAALWGSPADWVIVQMQDVLGLGTEARMNTPSTLGATGSGGLFRLLG